MVMPTLLRKLYDAFVTTGGVTVLATEASMSGLKIGLRITNLVVTDVEMTAPSLALTDRNSIIIENRGVDSIYYGNTGVTASGVNQGGEIPPNSSFAVDITDAIVLYIIAPTGKTVNAKVVEFA